MTQYVYRAYNKAGRLLYVGVTGNVERRMMQHRLADAPWIALVADMHVQTFKSRADAEAAEAEAIASEWPLWNILGSADPTARDVSRRQARAMRMQNRQQSPVGPVPIVPATPAVPAVPVPAVVPAEDLKTALTLLRTAVALLAEVAASLEAGPGQAAGARLEVAGRERQLA